MIDKVVKNKVRAKSKGQEQGQEQEQGTSRRARGETVGFPFGWGGWLMINDTQFHSERQEQGQEQGQRTSREEGLRGETVGFPLIKRILRYAIMSGNVVDDLDVAPLSVMLIAPPESNKTRILRCFGELKFVKYVTDMSAKPLIEFLKDAVNGKYTHIIIPDFIKVVSHNKNVVDAVISTLNALIEEGIQKSMFYGQEIELPKNVRCGILTSITPSLYAEHFKGWNDIGFVTRFLPISYTYSDVTIENIMNMINSRNNGHSIEPEKIRFLTKKKKIDIDDDVRPELKSIAIDITKRLKEYRIAYFRGKRRLFSQMDLRGFRLLKKITLLSKAIALDRGLASVNMSCIEELRVLSKYITLPNNPIIL